ncbi:MAG: DUF4252 domain-containing protein [Gammaproteobacteria bacterium]|jgi:hypothetical protein|nr:DUF4252 domain-containing protein [Xanthomonadales bacterium]
MKKILAFFILTLSFTALHAKSFVDDISKAIGSDPQVNINLGTGIISTILSFSDDEEAKKVNDFLSGLSKLRVTVFELDKSKNTKKLTSLVKSKIDDLLSKGYEQIVTVKESDEMVHIVAKVNGDKLEDAMVIVLEENDEMVVIDMQGTLDLKQLSKLSKNFDVNLNGVIADS